MSFLIRFFILLFVSIPFFNLYVIAQCSGPTIYSPFTSTPTTVTINIACLASPCQGVYCLEYGPPGFTPGNDTTPGISGTIIQLNAPPFDVTISGLNPETNYDCYLRRYCANLWSGNSSKRTVSTSPDCNLAQIITYNNIISLPGDSGLGGWNHGCGISNIGYGREKLFRFTPTFTGFHHLIVKDYAYSSHLWLFFYKESISGCNTNNWECIGSNSSYVTNTYQFGPLTAGVEYILRADCSWDNIPIAPTTFKIEGAACGIANSLNANFLSPHTAIVEWKGINYGRAEIGPHNFLPGSSSSPAPGTFVANGDSLNPAIIKNLPHSSTLDTYVRPSCGLIDGNYNIKFSNGNISPTCPFENYTGLGLTHNIYTGSSGFNWTYESIGSNCPFVNGVGIEKIIKFQSPVTGYFDLHYFNLDGLYNYGPKMKIHNGNCSPNTFSCIFPYYTNSSSSESRFIIELEKDSIYDFFIDLNDTTGWGGPSLAATLKIQCPVPDSLRINYISGTEVELEWFSYCDSVVVEYGPTNLNPGTGALPGINGTAVQLTGVNKYSISGLTPNATYKFYVRSICGGSYSPNSTRKFADLSNYCQIGQFLNCDSSAITTGIFYYNTIDGIWNTRSCLSRSEYPGKERFFRYTAQDSGMHHLYFNTTGGVTNCQAGVFYRDSNSGCNELGWICIGNNYIMPEFYTFGPLNAGTTYYIMLDGYNGGSCYVDISLFCPAPCTPPFKVTIDGITDSSAVIHSLFIDNPGIIYAEYGPVGFTPGTDSISGAGGTLISGFGLDDTLWNLTPATTYDLYIRQKCDSVVGYSNNFHKTFNTFSSNCVAGPSSIICINCDTICVGQAVTLMTQGVFPAINNVTPEIYWYADSCFGSPIDTTSANLTVSPVTTTTFYAIAYDSCGFTSCVSKTINVFPNSSVNITTTGNSFCPGDSVNADAGSGYSDYLWNNGSTSQAINIDQQGNYSVTVTDSNGCSSTDMVSISLIPAPPPLITGDSILCPSETTTLDAGSGYVAYSWSNGVITQTIAVNTIGIYSVTVINANGCSSSSEVEVTSVNVTPVILTAGSSIDFCQGDSVALIVAPGYNSYQWYRNNILLLGLINNQQYFFNSGNYKCEVTDSNGCEIISNSIRLRVVCIPIGPAQEKIDSMESLDQLLVEVTPNPAYDGFNFKIVCSGDDQPKIFIVDQRGLTIDAHLTQISKSEYFLAPLKPGFYFARIFCNNRQKVLKLVQFK